MLALRGGHFVALDHHIGGSGQLACLEHGRHEVVAAVAPGTRDSSYYHGHGFSSN
jgi:hypothetical protein